MQAMLEDVAPRLTKAVPVISRSITVKLPEGGIAEDLAAIQDRHPGLSIGSYPFFAAGDPAPGQRWTVGTTLVVRGRDEAEVQAAAQEIEALARAFGVAPEIFGKS
jgi:molybdopterin-biosynthesis enzyme MoeA-like protein